MNKNVLSHSDMRVYAESQQCHCSGLKQSVSGGGGEGVGASLLQLCYVNETTRK